MAIIQISRIQVRRGREQQGTGVPRLSSGELGWAVDTQRLYIGNGSIAEGAPQVGNTRILTDNDNILNLSDQYYYGGFNDLANQPFVVGVEARSLQSRLDDFVSASSFGIIGNGLADDTLSLQAAIDALFGVGVDRNTRSVLYIPAGTYRTTAPLKIPSFASIIGAGIENTVIVNDVGIVFETVADVTSNINLSQETQSRHIKISDLSIECNSNSSAIFLQSCRDSEFRNLSLIGSWFIPQPGNPDPVNNLNRAIRLDAQSSLVTCKNNLFENITIEKFATGIFAREKIINNSFRNFNLYELEKGFEFGAQNQLDNGPTLNVIENCNFNFIEKQGIEVLSGEYNTSRNNRYINVGNDGGADPVTPVIDFKTNTNISVNDYFDRTELTSPDGIAAPLLNKEYVSEVLGRTKFENLFAIETSIGQRFNFTPFIKLPLIDKGTIFVDYVYNVEGSTIVREGVLEITVDRASLSVITTDEYTATGDTVNANLLEFRASSVSNNPLTGADTLLIEAKNPTLNLTDDVFYYTIRSKT